MTFKPGDMVIVIERPGIVYPPWCQPGMVTTILGPCSCPRTTENYWRVDLSGPRSLYLCLSETIIRKIDPDGREVVRWEHCVWRPARLKEAA